MFLFVARFALVSILLAAAATGSAFAGKLGPEFRINTTTTSDQLDPHAASFPDGSFIVVWQSYGQDGDHYGVYGQRFTKKGKKTGKEFRVSRVTASVQNQPAVAVMPDGGFVVVYQSALQDGDDSGVFGQRFAAKGKRMGKAFQVNRYSMDAQSAPAIATLAKGGFVVTWESLGQDGSGPGIYGQRISASGKRVGAEFHVSTFTASSQTHSRVAALPDGGFVVVWGSYTQDGGGYGVYGQRYNRKAKRVGGEFQVNTTTAMDQDRPSVAPLSNGGFVVVWESNGQDGSGYGIYGQLFGKKGAKVGGEFRVSTTTGDSQSVPDVALLGNGGFVATWQSFGQDGSLNAVVAQKFTKQGAKSGGEFPVNTSTGMNQGLPRIAALGKRGFVIVWSSEGQDGSDYGIYGQRLK